VRPRQVHGVRVMKARRAPGPEREEADAIISDVPGLPVAVVTADCVPILVAELGGACVAAVHAGWRGLAAGVVAEALSELARSGAAPTRLRAVIGPHIGPCCYEVDAPVLDALTLRFGEVTETALRPGRPGHAFLDLGALVRVECLRAGLAPTAVGAVPSSCTRCDSERFHSYRRDGARAGRLVHSIAATAGALRKS